MSLITVFVYFYRNLQLTCKIITKFSCKLYKCVCKGVIDSKQWEFHHATNLFGIAADPLLGNRPFIILLGSLAAAQSFCLMSSSGTQVPQDTRRMHRIPTFLTPKSKISCGAWWHFPGWNTSPNLFGLQFCCCLLQAVERHTFHINTTTNKPIEWRFYFCKCAQLAEHHADFVSGSMYAENVNERKTVFMIPIDFRSFAFQILKELIVLQGGILVILEGCLLSHMLFLKF